MKLPIHCKFDEMVSVAELKKRFNQDNNNIHNQDQIEQLAKIMEYQGIRKNVVCRRDTKTIQSGHGRVLSADFLGLTEYPVEYQDYKDDDQSFADLTADNAIARQSDLDFSMVNAKLQDLDPSFDLDWLGIKDFTVDVADKMDELDKAARGSMREKFGAPPFSVLDAKQGWWQERKRQWIARGIRSHLGRGGEMSSSYKSQSELSALRRQTKKTSIKG